MAHKMVDGMRVEMTAAEEAAFEAERRANDPMRPENRERLRQTEAGQRADEPTMRAMMEVQADALGITVAELRRRFIQRYRL